MEKVTLYDERNERVSVTVNAYFDSSGNLVIDGYDRGPFVEERTGDWDYEYMLTVLQEHLRLLSILLIDRSTEKHSLLEAIRDNFQSPLAFSSFKSFLKDNDIPFSLHSY